MPNITRRGLLKAGLATSGALLVPEILLSCKDGDRRSRPSDLGSQYRLNLLNSSTSSAARGTWRGDQINEFIGSMGRDPLKNTCKTLSIQPSEVSYADSTQMQVAIKRKLSTITGSTWMTRDNPERISYHENVLIPVAKRLSVQKDVINNGDTLLVERAVQQQVLANQWDPMTDNQRVTFLRNCGLDIPDDKVSALAAFAGAGILAGLATYVTLTGFEFYVAMSSGIYALAATMGLTLPFAAYTAASSAIALATGPIGWTVAGVLAIIGLYEWLRIGRDERDALQLRYVIHQHNYRVAAMREADLQFM